MLMNINMEPIVTNTPRPSDAPGSRDRLGVETLIGERRRTHGEYSDVAEVAQSLKATLRTGTNWDKMHVRNRESLDLIATKIARIVCGDEFHSDHWMDIEGYCKIAARQ